jgi:hypothetical protein
MAVILTIEATSNIPFAFLLLSVKNRGKIRFKE